MNLQGKWRIACRILLRGGYWIRARLGHCSGVVGKLGTIWMSVFAFSTMGCPSGCLAAMAASFGTIMFYVLRSVCSWLLEWACQAFHAGVRAAQVCLVVVCVSCHSSPASPSVNSLVMHLPMMAARLASAVVCVDLVL